MRKVNLRMKLITIYLLLGKFQIFNFNYSGIGRIRLHKNGNMLNGINEANSVENNRGIINNNLLRIQLQQNNNMINMEEPNDNLQHQDDELMN